MSQRPRSGQREQAIPQQGIEPDGAGSSDERILRSKYFDWCSARIAERFMNLGVEEIYALAGTVVPSDLDQSASPAEGGPFQDVMERATAALAAQTELPAFEAWVKAYRSDPASYDADMIGFWKDRK